jgi:CheY-like chemotaxis protein
MAKILIAEDKKHRQEALKSFLRGKEYETNDTPASVENVEACVDSGLYDALFMTTLKISRREGNGSDEYENGLGLVKYSVEKGLPVIVLTAARDEVVEQARQLGAESVLRRPETATNILRALEKAGI